MAEKKTTTAKKTTKKSTSKAKTAKKPKVTAAIEETVAPVEEIVNETVTVADEKVIEEVPEIQEETPSMIEQETVEAKEPEIPTAEPVKEEVAEDDEDDGIEIIKDKTDEPEKKPIASKPQPTRKYRTTNQIMGVIYEY